MGIKDLFKKNKITSEQLLRKLKPNALTIFDKGGVPLTSNSSDDVLKGGLFSAITNFIKQSFHSELNQLEIGGNIIIFKRSNYLMASIIIDNPETIDPKDAEKALNDLLCYLEKFCPNIEKDNIDKNKLEILIKKYSNNLMD